MSPFPPCLFLLVGNRVSGQIDGSGSDCLVLLPSLFAFANLYQSFAFEPVGASMQAGAGEL